ncbi:MAG: 30S ribosomal protein S21 [Patescibacteria group bacterium]|nr:30S ribosomal protein S21 [Patescibacteria group bacterium]
MKQKKGGVFLYFMSIVVKAGPGDSTDSVIRKFQKRVVAEGIVQEIRDRSVYRKPSELRQEYLAEKRRKIMRARRYSK